VSSVCSPCAPCDRLDSEAARSRASASYFFPVAELTSYASGFVGMTLPSLSRNVGARWLDFRTVGFVGPAGALAGPFALIGSGFTGALIAPDFFAGGFFGATGAFGASTAFGGAGFQADGAFAGGFAGSSGADVTCADESNEATTSGIAHSTANLLRVELIEASFTR
jgi:hypothetical protein